MFVGLNTLMREPILEGFVDAFGPFNPAAIIGENFNNASQRADGHVAQRQPGERAGRFKAPPLRNVS